MFSLPALRTAFRRSATTATPLARQFSASAARNYAHLTVVGRLGAKPELASTRSGTEYVKFNVASSSGSGENRKTSWFRISSFRQNKDYLLGLEKGTLMVVDCSASLNTFDNQDGTRTTALACNEKSLTVLERGRSEEATEGSPE